MSIYTPDMEYFEDIKYQEFLLTSKRKAICPPEKIFQEIRYRWKDARNIVDFGMGLGFFTPFIRQRMHKDAWLWGVECQQDLIDLILKKKVDQNITNFSAVFLEKTEHPLLPQWIPHPDLIFASLSLSTFANPGLAMDGLVRSMNDGGTLVIIDWAKTDHPSGPQLKDKVSAEKMKYLAELYDLEVVNYFSITEFFYGLEVKPSPDFKFKFYDYRD
ncbi:MAG TPA: methyltransferase domain-containing protein [Leptospiraceae bacterium]|nr:methyltransferase domain-containing protein [Leptospiraceae bacterium]HNF25047.1 methyltransferase domain-containing protein [Leptospiraceae bacterium]HNH08731.1 methyltransferase domain-containing protein [Leptospiraceae bacterium]HNI26545.1 methyltransferase domain-containing protein [Leptospiraceae bacterium]HNM04196.1 methyltransferase domain-containing protein [Leptospiraceae bacterium]